jgi:hypothetical protein
MVVVWRVVARRKEGGEEGERRRRERVGDTGSIRRTKA